MAAIKELLNHGPSVINHADHSEWESAHWKRLVWLSCPLKGSLPLLITVAFWGPVVAGSLVYISEASLPSLEQYSMYFGQEVLKCQHEMITIT